MSSLNLKTSSTVQNESTKDSNNIANNEDANQPFNLLDEDEDDFVSVI